MRTSPHLPNVFIRVDNFYGDAIVYDITYVDIPLSIFTPEMTIDERNTALDDYMRDELVPWIKTVIDNQKFEESGC